MRLWRHRVLPVLVSVALGGVAGLTAGVPALAADPDAVAPVGRYRLDFTNLWNGQSATLTALEVSDDVSAQPDIRQYVDWGDGNFSYLDGDVKSERHQFFNPGSYTVTVRVTDRAGNSSSGVFEGRATVTVGKVPGTYRIVKKEVYDGDPAIVTLADIPSDVTKVRIWWGDGEDTTVSRTTRQVQHYYSGSTSWYVSVLLTNKAGESYGREIGSIYTTYDEIPPQISLTRPKKPTYVSSWRTINGKVSDRGRGTVAVGTALIQQRGSSWYHYTGTKWTRAKSLNQALRKARTIQVRPTARNTWQVKVKGLKKGTLYVFYAAVDKDRNESEAKVRKQKLTR